MRKTVAVGVIRKVMRKNKDGSKTLSGQADMPEAAGPEPAGGDDEGKKKKKKKAKKKE